MRSFAVDVILTGNAYMYRGDGPEQYGFYANLSQKVEIEVDAKNEEEAIEFALNFDYAHHIDCEIEDDCEIYDVIVYDIGNAENRPASIHFRSAEMDK